MANDEELKGLNSKILSEAKGVTSKLIKKGMYKVYPEKENIFQFPDIIMCNYHLVFPDNLITRFRRALHLFSAIEDPQFQDSLRQRKLRLQDKPIHIVAHHGNLYTQYICQVR